MTRKQHELLVFIDSVLTRSPVAPSFGEMQLALELRSKSGVNRLITALEEQRLIERGPNLARRIALTARGRTLLRPELSNQPVCPHCGRAPEELADG